MLLLISLGVYACAPEPKYEDLIKEGKKLLSIGDGFKAKERFCEIVDEVPPELICDALWGCVLSDAVIVLNIIGDTIEMIGARLSEQPLEQKSFPLDDFLAPALAQYLVSLERMIEYLHRIEKNCQDYAFTLVNVNFVMPIIGTVIKEPEAYFKPTALYVIGAVTNLIIGVVKMIYSTDLSLNIVEVLKLIKDKIISLSQPDLVEIFRALGEPVVKSRKFLTPSTKPISPALIKSYPELSVRSQLFADSKYNFAETLDLLALFLSDISKMRKCGHDIVSIFLRIGFGTLCDVILNIISPFIQDLIQLLEKWSSGLKGESICDPLRNYDVLDKSDGCIRIFDDMMKIGLLSLLREPLVAETIGNLIGKKLQKIISSPIFIIDPKAFFKIYEDELGLRNILPLIECEGVISFVIEGEIGKDENHFAKSVSTVELVPVPFKPEIPKDCVFHNDITVPYIALADPSVGGSLWITLEALSDKDSDCYEYEYERELMTTFRMVSWKGGAGKYKDSLYAMNKFISNLVIGVYEFTRKLSGVE